MGSLWGAPCLEKQLIFLPQQLSVAIAPWPAGICTQLPSPCWDFVWMCTGLLHAVTVTGNSYAQLSSCAQKTLFGCRHPLSGSYNLSIASATMISEPWKEEVRYRCSIQGWTFQSLCTLASCGSVLITIYLCVIKSEIETSLMKVEDSLIYV